jgi:hypothetical protein
MVAWYMRVKLGMFRVVAKIRNAKSGQCLQYSYVIRIQK